MLILNCCASAVPPVAQEHIRERVQAMAVFKAFVSTAQREFVAQERAKNPAATQFRVCCWLGHAVWCLVAWLCTVGWGMLCSAPCGHGRPLPNLLADCAAGAWYGPTAAVRVSCSCYLKVALTVALYPAHLPACSPLTCSPAHLHPAHLYPPCPPAGCPPTQGYANKKMERLRQGIGPEDIDLVRPWGL